MSANDFYGRPIRPGTEYLEFDTCEVCLRKSPQYLEIQYQDNTPIVRFTCTDCHENYLNRGSGVMVNIAREISDEDELEQNVRPGWVDEFIKEGADSGVITTLGDEDLTPVADQTVEFSQAPESFIAETPEVSEEEEENEQVQIANWASKFIQEALFGPNPEGWLESIGAYEPESFNITLVTLSSFANHDVSSVKLSAIQCLSGLHRRGGNPETIKNQLKLYIADSDETVSEFAEQIYNQI